MKKGVVKLDNSRYPDQRERMILLSMKVGCFFCKKNYLKVGASDSIHEGNEWYIKKNDYPYEGTRYHYLLAPKKHVTKISEISPKAFAELLKMIKFLEKLTGVKGYSILSRNGDVRYTGATLDHLHFHFVSGGPKKKGGALEDNVRFTLAHKSTRPQRS